MTSKAKRANADNPVRPRSLLAVLATLAPLTEELPPIRELPLDPVEL